MLNVKSNYSCIIDRGNVKAAIDVRRRNNFAKAIRHNQNSLS